MADRLDLYFRGYTIPEAVQTANWRAENAKVPEHALIFHCATTSDERQDPLVGAYIRQRSSEVTQ